MILDNYSQLYIEVSQDIKTRIQSHWSKQKEFDCLIFGGKENPILSIDSFRAYDTTRIFVYLIPDYIKYEDTFINQIKSKYCLNRTRGGTISGLLEAIRYRKKRKLL